MTIALKKCDHRRLSTGHLSPTDAVSASSLRPNPRRLVSSCIGVGASLFFLHQMSSRIVHRIHVDTGLKKRRSLAPWEINYLPGIVVAGSTPASATDQHPPYKPTPRTQFPFIPSSHQVMVKNVWIVQDYTRDGQWSGAYPERIRRNVSVWLVTLKLEGMTECSRYSPRII